MTEPRLPRRRLAYAAMAGLLLMGAGAFTRTLDPANADLLSAIAYVLVLIFYTTVWMLWLFGVPLVLVCITRRIETGEWPAPSDFYGIFR